MLKNRRGLELAIGSVAILAIVLLVVVIVISFLLGGFGKAGGGIQQISGEGEAGAANLNLSFKCFATSKGVATTCAAKITVADCNNEKNCYWAYG